MTGAFVGTPWGSSWELVLGLDSGVLHAYRGFATGEPRLAKGLLPA